MSSIQLIIGGIFLAALGVVIGVSLADFADTTTDGYLGMIAGLTVFLGGILIYCTGKVIQAIEMNKKE